MPDGHVGHLAFMKRRAARQIWEQGVCFFHEVTGRGLDLSRAAAVSLPATASIRILNADAVP
jgi:hypothetical protein